MSRLGRLAVGDRVVYGSHGIGRVESRRAAKAGVPESVVLAFETGLRVTLPVARAREALRTLSGPDELEDVRRALRATASPTLEPWPKRQRMIRDAVNAGTVTGLAEVVRDGLHRERKLADGPAARQPAPVERDLYLQARRLLVAEIAACRRIEPEAADAWIVEQISDAG
ncbi:MAG TPA: CarD family transcriptional regulator [Gaiellaceae bacterium]|nr:CarD family transcriptional regulator [Gaiellaceae bacterium]